MRLARRSLLRHVAILIAALIATSPAWSRTADETRLVQFAREVGLADVDEFVETVISLRARRALPERYLTKRAAEALGWRPGDDLCRVAPGRALGGDRFGNRERRLPEASGRVWREADLDFACGRRGPRRLLWSSDGLVFVTVDHYQTFKAVPP
jgi:hypothetical protein